MTEGFSYLITDHLPTHHTKASLNHTEYDEMANQDKSFVF